MIIDLTGQRFGRLTAIRRMGCNKHRQSFWECRCECSNTVTVMLNSLIAGNTRSCGCLRRRRRDDHAEKQVAMTETYKPPRTTEGDFNGSPVITVYTGHVYMGKEESVTGGVAFHRHPEQAADDYSFGNVGLPRSFFIIADWL